MGLKRLFSGKEKSRPSTASQIQQNSASPICDIFREGVYLKQQLTERLVERATKGAEFFETYNESRMKLAFHSFGKTMSMALFDILYLLNTNEPWLKEYKYKTKRLTGSKLIEESEASADLYLEGAPFGIRGIDRLSSLLRKPFEEYVEKEFGHPFEVKRNGRHLPIDGIFSIGSIGTIGHKQVASDLDLQIQYDLEPFQFDVNSWTDEIIKAALKKEYNRLMDRYFQKKQLDPASVNAETRKKVKAFFKKSLSSKYPLLFRYFIAGRNDVLKVIRQSKENKMRSELIREVINLMKLDARTARSKENENGEALLKERIKRIQNYIQHKFPEEEIYLFPFSLHEFRKGHFSPTTESKESSGGAYELILNYETLMPGIYFTPNIPSHFVFPPDINNNASTFDKLNEYLRFGIVNILDGISNRLINQGPTPDLKLSYVAQHYSAVYWEAFKASYGNLPKATLNLLRYESLLENKINKTIIQLIKQPDMLDELAMAEDNIEDLLKKNHIVSPQQVIEMEKEFPQLLYDPWWLRYKALKFAFSIPNLVNGIESKDLVEISENIDLAFALHIRLSDVFSLSREQQTSAGHREKVLIRYLDLAFPKDSQRRKELHATFIGHIETVNLFEKKLRKIFQGCIVRVHSKASRFLVDEKSSEEFKLWHHYYSKNFTPKTNMIPRSILSHLQTPRGRVQIGFEKGKGWFFKSLQRESKIGRRFEASVLNLLPEEITLIRNTKFLYGLAYCVLNGYYGIYSTGTLKETRTAVEYDRSHSNTGSRYDNHLAFVRPDQIERIMQQMKQLYAPIKVGYMDCINKTRRIISMMVFLNLQKYGCLSLLYRDNLDVFYLDTYDIPDFEKHAEQYMTSYQKMLKSVGIHKVLGRFFKENEIDVGNIELLTWINTNCVETNHATTNEVAKERDLSTAFKQVIMSVHGPKAGSGS
mgnify:CR=1 FL=1